MQRQVGWFNRESIRAANCGRARIVQDFEARACTSLEVEVHLLMWQWVLKNRTRPYFYALSPLSPVWKASFCWGKYSSWQTVKVEQNGSVLQEKCKIKRTFIKIATSKCSYCGAEPRETGYGVVCNGIDRIDNSRGYTLDNVSSCCTRCNIMKGNMSRNEFLDHISKIVKTCDVRFNDYPCGEYAKAGGNEELPFKKGRWYSLFCMVTCSSMVRE